MLALVLTMVLSQTPVVTPAAGQPPIGFPSTLEPLRIEGGAIAWRNPDYWVAWTDRRRGYDAPSAPVDVWVGQWNENTQTMSQVSSRFRGPFLDVKLAVSSTDSRLYAVRSDDAGVQVIVSSLTGATSPSPLMATPAAVNGIAVAAVENEFLLAVRRAGVVSLIRESGMIEQVTTGASIKDLRVTGADGGFLVSFVDSGGPRFAPVPLGQFMSGRPAPVVPIAGPPNLLAPLPLEPPSFVTSDSNGVRLHLFDAGVFRVQPLQSLASQTLLVSSIQDSTRAVIVNDFGVITVPSGGGPFSTGPFDAGTPLGLALHDGTGALLSSYGGAAAIRGITVADGGLPNTGTPVLLTTMAPQRAPTAIWSPTTNQFLMAWEQRSATGFEVMLTSVDRNGMFASPQRLMVAGHSPRLLEGPDDGGVAMQLWSPPDAGAQTTYSYVSPVTLGVLGNFRQNSSFTQALLRPTFLSWTLTNPTTVLGHGTLLTQAPRCVAVAGGVSWFSGVNGNQLVIESVPGARLISATTMADDSPGCAAVGTDGTVLVVAKAGRSVQFAHVDAVQMRLINSFNAPSMALTGDPVVTALGDGFLVAWPEGQNIVAFEVKGSPLTLTSQNLNPARGAVSELVATSSPAGEALVAWHAFEPDGGVHSVWARVVSVPGLDGGVAVNDAGAGVIDAGVVVPVNDAGAGVVDAGVVVPVNDAGSGVVDAGVVVPVIDAGSPEPMDAGTGGTDGGPGAIEFVPVCGCSSADPGLVAALALVLALTRRRGREAARGVFR